MRTKSRVLFLTWVLLVLAATPARAAQIHAKSAFAMDMATGNILYEQNADQPIPPASLTKVLTLYLTFEAIEEKKLSFTDRVLVSPEATLTSGSRMNIKPGERVIVRELMKGIAVASGNDACIAIAQHLSGREDYQPFVDAMNKKAHELGMASTVFKNPNGLPAEGQFTTARDMARLAGSYLYRFPQSLTFHSMTTYVHNNHNHHNANRLLLRYDGVDGLKTGFIQASGYNNVVTAKRGENRVIAVVLGARSPGARAAETGRLLDMAFQRLADRSEKFASLDYNRSHGVSPLALAVPRQTSTPSAEARAEAPQQPQAAQAGAQANAQVQPGAQAQAAQPQPVLVKRSAGQNAFAVQESSFQSKRKAERRAQDLERKGLPVRVVSADLGSKGRFYRVLVGPYASIEDAQKTREKIIGHGSVTTEQ